MTILHELKHIRLGADVLTISDCSPAGGTVATFEIHGTSARSRWQLSDDGTLISKARGGGDVGSWHEAAVLDVRYSVAIGGKAHLSREGRKSTLPTCGILGHTLISTSHPEDRILSALRTVSSRRISSLPTWMSADGIVGAI